MAVSVASCTYKGRFGSRPHLIHTTSSVASGLSRRCKGAGIYVNGFKYALAGVLVTEMWPTFAFLLDVICTVRLWGERSLSNLRHMAQSSVNDADGEVWPSLGRLPSRERRYLLRRCSIKNASVSANMDRAYPFILGCVQTMIG
ncbi:hypothetical protein DPMN_084384 [Dreissena polymorpha]|uniref:Uncharacterized protein n=1 Tax=Dreissena polymorpha TaxID=45954 RepID=A0A9D3YD11_DREPO|nr:hypothetical protein DPMN_084384 [Dreissena polymorpha]